MLNMQRAAGNLPRPIPAYLKDSRQSRLAELLTGVYEAIVWGHGAEFYAFDGLFDLATIAGC